MKKKDLLLVIDMQNVYLPGKDWACPSMTRAAEHIRTLLDADIVQQTIFTRFVPPVQPAGTWRRYNEENASINADAYLNDMMEELKPYLDRYPLCDKSVYSSMRIPEIAEAARHADRIVLTGVVAECCVLSTMMEAVDDGHTVVYLYDCIAGQSEQNETCIRRIAESFSYAHTQVMSSAEYLAEL